MISPTPNLTVIIVNNNLLAGLVFLTVPTAGALLVKHSNTVGATLGLGAELLLLFRQQPCLCAGPSLQEGGTTAGGGGAGRGWGGGCWDIGGGSHCG